MERSSQIAWKIVPLRHFFPLKVVPLIADLLYRERIYHLLSFSSDRIAQTVHKKGWEGGSKVKAMHA
jgi:hypothetical protein